MTVFVLGAFVSYGLAALWLTAVFARRVVTKPGVKSFDVEILGIDAAKREIRLARTPETVLPGEYSLIRYGASSICNVSEVTAVDETSVTRVLSETQTVPISLPRVGEFVRFSGWLYLEPRHLPLARLGLRARDVQLKSDHWILPAWELRSEESRADDDTWVIHVHGRAATRAEVLRGVEALSEYGYSHLVMSYRNDSEALHNGEDLERYTLGALESRDVQIAMQYALSRGATRLLLYGWSMGGNAVLQAAAESEESTRICGIILDSPALDWHRILVHQGSLAGVPRHLSLLAIGLLNHGLVKTDAGKRLNVHRMYAPQLLKRISSPVLILHSVDDDYVPFEPAASIAQRYPDNITLVTFNGAAHVKLYNYDPSKYLNAISGWLRSEIPGL